MLGGTRFDLVYGVTTTAFITGMFLDSWAHENVPHLETFWTPWHAVLYSGIFASLALLAGTMVLNRRRGAPSWREAIPFGYAPAVVGALGMIVASAGDATWHTFFGIEKNVDALFSPTHLLIIICSSLMALGPLRAMYHRRVEPVSLGEHVRLAYALMLFYALLMVVAQGTHPFVIFKLPLTAHTGQDNEQLLAAASFVLQASILAGCALAVLRRWTLRFGFFTFVLTIVGVALAQLHNFQVGIPISLGAGLAIDSAYVLLKPNPARPTSLRLFSALASAALPAFYLLGLRIADGPLAWTIHMLIGSVIMCAIFGWLLSYLVVPSQME